jgi:lipoyl(octanoyl) transferase
MPLRGRVLLTGARSGAWNMALDEALLATAREGVVTIRLYAWAPATATLGYFQPRSSVPAEVAARHPLVRRPTGGGALIHAADEITISLTGMGSSRAPRPEEAAGWMLAGLRAALSPLGLEPRFADDPASPRDGREGVPGGRTTPFFCGAIRRPLDVMVDLARGGRKLLGSAQRRRGKAWLIHGGLPVEHPQRIEGEPEGTSVSEALEERGGLAGAGRVEGSGAAPEARALRDRLLEALAASFPAALGAEPDPTPLTHDEEALAFRLLAEKYSTRAWLYRA